MKKKSIVLISLLSISSMQSVTFTFGDLLRSIFELGEQSGFEGLKNKFRQASRFGLDNTFGEDGWAAYSGTSEIKRIFENKDRHTTAGTKPGGFFVHWLGKDDSTPQHTANVTTSHSFGNAAASGDTVYVLTYGGGAYDLTIYKYTNGNAAEGTTSGVLTTLSGLGYANGYSLIYKDGLFFNAQSSGPTVRYLYKLNASGSLDATFNSGSALSLTAAGFSVIDKMIIAGRYIYVGGLGAANKEIQRFDIVTGAADATYGTLDTGVTSVIQDMAVDSKGNLYVSYTDGATSTGTIIKFNAAGTQITDNTWGSSGVVTFSSTQYPLHMRLGAGKIFMHVFAANVGSTKQVWGLDSKGSVIADSDIISSNPLAISGAGYVNDIIYDYQDRLVVAGSNTSSPSSGALWRFRDAFDAGSAVQKAEAGTGLSD